MALCNLVLRAWAAWALVGAVVSSTTRGQPATPPHCPTVSTPTVCVLGGDDAGTGAAWAAARLQIPTVLVLTHRRDLGGDPSSFYYDGAEMVLSGGGLNMEVYATANVTGVPPFANVLGGPGGAFLFFDTLFRTAPLNNSLEILEGYIAAPNSGVVDADGRVESLELIARDSNARCTLSCRYVIEGSPEGYGAAAFGLPIVFGREARENSSDPTLRFEQYAGRRTFAVTGHGPPIEEWSDPSVETEDTSAADGPITSLCQYSQSPAQEIPDDSPWLLTTIPEGYDHSLYVNGSGKGFHEGACCAPNPTGCSPQVFRYQGLTLTSVFANTGSTGPTIPRWYILPDSPQHYLRRAYANPDQLWELKRRIELQSFSWAVNGVWHLQNHVEGGKGWGFCTSVFPSTNPALQGDKRTIPVGPYRLSDFNTSSYGGDQTIAARLYHRTLARLASPTPVGAAQLYDGAPRAATAAENPGTIDHGNRKWAWEPEAISFPLYGTDFTKGVLGNTVPLHNATSNGKVLLSSGDGVLFGNGPGDGNMHGTHRRILFPDSAATAASIQSPGRPPAGNFTQTFVTNFLSPGSPRSTFMLQASARIGGYASNLGVAAGVYTAWAEKLGTHNTSAVPTMLVQWALAANLTTAITFFKPPLRERGEAFAALQIAGAYAVPPSLNLDTSVTVSQAELTLWLGSYTAGVLTGVIPPGVPGPTPPSECLPNGSWYAYTPDWDFTPTRITAVAKPTYNCPLGALLKTCEPKSTTLPPADVRCFKPGTSLKLTAPPKPSGNSGLEIVQPVFGPSVRVDDHRVGLASPSGDSVGAHSDPSNPATRGALFAALDKIAQGTAAEAMRPPSPSSQGLAITVLDLAQVVVRHAAVMRQRLHGEEIMAPLNLLPFEFSD